MNYLDYTSLSISLLFIVGYGVWKTRKQNSMEGYLRGSNMQWGTIGLSIMATQASAITFISTPGVGFTSGMGFVQNYLGLPIALIVVSAVFIPLFYRFKVYTAYEFLERRFDVKTRTLGAFLFLVQRGLATGITIYAPAIILSYALNWSLAFTILLTGTLVIIYTVSGGTRAVAVTQKYQMIIILGGIFFAFYILMDFITAEVSFGDALRIAGSLEKLDAIKWEFDISERYTIWSGLAGGFFLALAYFGTDQSQVQRYLGGKNLTEIRFGLMFNALLKIPMQFFILFLGVMLYVFYIFYAPPPHFNASAVDTIEASEYAPTYEVLKQDFAKAHEKRKASALDLASSNDILEIKKNNLIKADNELKEIVNQANNLALKANPSDSSKMSDYVFLSFILDYLPNGLIGLLIAMIFSAAMSSTASELNALASTTAVDFYKRLIKTDGTDKHYLTVSKLLTLGWGGVAISFAFFVHQSENLIEAVNIIGSVFYGTILGIFLVAFFLKKVSATAVFWGAIIAQSTIFFIFILSQAGMIDIGYLWFNFIGCGLTILISGMISALKIHD